MAEFETDYLAHHGIKGQKWGVRRFQNPDGTRTEEGKKRYSSGSSESGSSVGSWAKAHKKELAIAGGVALAAAGTALAIKYGNVPFDVSAMSAANKAAIKAGKNYAKYDAKNSREALKAAAKGLRKMSDKDLYALKDRLETEKKVRKLIDEELYPGKEFAIAQMKGVGGKVFNAVGAGAILYGAKAVAQDKFDKKEFANAIYNGGPKKK